MWTIRQVHNSVAVAHQQQCWETCQWSLQSLARLIGMLRQSWSYRWDERIGFKIPLSDIITTKQWWGDCRKGKVMEVCHCGPQVPQVTADNWMPNTVSQQSGMSSQCFWTLLASMISLFEKFKHCHLWGQHLLDEIFHFSHALIGSFHPQTDTLWLFALNITSAFSWCKKTKKYQTFLSVKAHQKVLKNVESNFGACNKLWELGWQWVNIVLILCTQACCWQWTHVRCEPKTCNS
jgi:hypothetical protein